MVTKKTSRDETNNSISSYTDEDVDFLEGLNAVRTRPDMYVGGIETAAFHLAKEVVDNSVDEVLNGFATEINVELFPAINRITISDNGRGMPVGMNKKLNKPTIEVLFTQLHSGGKFNKNAFKVSGGKNGIDVLVPFSGDANRKSI